MRAAPVLWLAACIDYSPAGKPGDPEVIGRDTSRPDAEETGGDTDDTASSREEVCDGLDNDGDGLTDEEFPDIDVDAVADCVDTTCVVALDGDEELSEAHWCERSVTAAVDPWNVELLWELDISATCFNIVAADLFADGTVELVCAETITGRLQLIDGRTGRRFATIDGVADYTGIAIADLDGDGRMNILVYNTTGAIVAYEPDGGILWTGPVVLREVGYEVDPIEVVDLDEDGRPEIVGQYAILRSDGTLFTPVGADEPDDLNHTDIAAADLDGDGNVDILSEWARFQSDGAMVWEYVPPDHGRWSSIPLLVQADGDDDAEVVWAGDNFFAVVESDGGIVEEHAGDMYASFPCAGDMDGDGDMDLLVVGTTGTRAWSLPSTQLWVGPYVDLTEISVGCTTFDSDLDGRKEVVYGDGEALYVLDGTTGTVLYQHDRVSPTADDRVLVVDLDGDDSVEIVASTFGGGYGPMLRAYGNVNRDWPPGTQMWPSATWSGTSLLPDGRVPRTPHKPWLTTKVWRGQPEVPIFGSDLRPAIGDTCVASCEADGEVRMAVRLENLGPDEVEAGVPVAVYGLDGTGERVLLTVLTSAQWLDDGRAGASWEVVTTTAQAARGLVIVAGDDGTGSVHADDCGGDNNTVEWALTECP